MSGSMAGGIGSMMVLTLAAVELVEAKHVQSVLRHTLVGHTRTAMGVSLWARCAGIGQIQSVWVGRELSG